MEMSDKELLEIALENMADALCALFEMKEKHHQALAFMLDSCIKLGTVMYHEGDILSASANWEQYETALFEKKRLKVVK